MLQTTAPANFKFKKLFKAIKEQEQKYLLRDIAALNNYTTVEQVQRGTGIKPPRLKKHSHLKPLEAIREAAKDKLIKAREKALNKSLQHLIQIAAANDFTGGRVQIEWKKSRQWGSNPTATFYGGGDRCVSGSIGGCGYDKQSTAFAEAINQHLPLLKALYQVKEKHPAINNRELFGYGSGYGILPQLEGGVGTSCFPRIFERIGFKMTTTASGNTFDAYSIEKKRKGKA